MKVRISCSMSWLQSCLQYDIITTRVRYEKRTYDNVNFTTITQHDSQFLVS